MSPDMRNSAVLGWFGEQKLHRKVRVGCATRSSLKGQSLWVKNDPESDYAETQGAA
jgi:hypothetical protein